MKRPKDPGPYPCAEEYRFVRNTPRWFKWSGEYRAPKAGEWFLSGARVEAYQASNDLTQEYFIAEPITLKTCAACGGRGEVEA